MAQTLTIRTTTLDDLPAIDALLARSYPVLLKRSYAPSVMVTAVPLISKAQPNLLKSGSYFAVCDGEGHIVGAGGWTSRAPRGFTSDEVSGHIRHVVTDHRRVRQGIGRALMDHIFAHARAHDVTRLECLSTLTAVPFYGACGFSWVGQTTIDLAPGVAFPAVAMQRWL